MRQQINLYKLLPKKSRYQLTPRVVLSTYTALIVLLLLTSMIQFFEKRRVLWKYTVLNKQVVDVQKEYSVLTEQYPMSDAISLKNAEEVLQHDLKIKSKILNLLTAKENFSTYLLSLANVDVQGLWLTEIQFSNVDEKINLKGYALQTPLVEQMIAQLNVQPAFSNLKFEIQNIIESPLPPSFEIQAKEEIS